MKLDSNLAWKEAAASVAANKEVLLVLAGVFFLLPSLAFALFYPAPEPQAGMQPEQIMTMMQEFYMSALPILIPMAIAQTAGSLAVLTLFTDRRRPTVGAAIKQGFIGVIPYFATQLLLVLALAVLGGIVGAMIGGLAALTGSTAVAAVLAAMLVAALIYVMFRLALVAPVIAVDRVYNPIAVLTRVWSLTRGNAGRIAAFLLLVIVAFVIVVAVVMGVLGMVLTLALGGGAAKIAASVLSSAFGAVFTLYFMAILAAVHRQLAGPSVEMVSSTFE
jgi:hypothetical protein